MVWYLIVSKHIAFDNGGRHLSICPRGEDREFLWREWAALLPTEDIHRKEGNGWVKNERGNTWRR